MSWIGREEWHCHACGCGGVRGTEDMHSRKCSGEPHAPGCSVGFASDPATGQGICDCGRALVVMARDALAGLLTIPVAGTTYAEAETWRQLNLPQYEKARAAIRALEGA